MQRHYPAKPARVYFFGTCLIDLFYPEAGMAGIQLLQREGIEVIYPQQQSCCGQPAYNSGYDEQARQVAEKQIACLEEDIPVVIPSASCTSMFVQHYPKLFQGRPLEAQATQLAHRCFELTEFLVHVCDIRLKDKGEPIKVAVHHSCSAQRHHPVIDDAERLLGQLDQVTITPHQRSQECCGFGGTFAVKEAEISNAMVQDKCQSLEQTAAAVALSGDGGCLMNIEGALGKRCSSIPAKHLVSFLWERSQ